MSFTLSNPSPLITGKHSDEGTTLAILLQLFVSTIDPEINVFETYINCVTTIFGITFMTVYET